MERYIKLPDGGVAWEPDLSTEREQPQLPNVPVCPKCGKPMEEQDTWVDVHHYVCLDCHTERTPLRKNLEDMKNTAIPREKFEKWASVRKAARQWLTDRHLQVDATVPFWFEEWRHEPRRPPTTEEALVSFVEYVLAYVDGAGSAYCLDQSADGLLKRIEDYRTGYSAGYADGKNGERMRDKDAACLLFGISGVPDISARD